MRRAHGLKMRGVVTFGAVVCGLLFGAVPALAAAPETPLTENVTAVTGTTATFHGEPNPGTPETVGYEFHFNDNGSCEGSTAGTTPPAGLLAGEKVLTPVKELEGSTEYMVCIVAFNK